jgi:hypothetical protein
MLNAGRETRQTIVGQKEAKGDFSTALDANEIFHFPFHISYFSQFFIFHFTARIHFEVRR